MTKQERRALLAERLVQLIAKKYPDAVQKVAKDQTKRKAK